MGRVQRNDGFYSLGQAAKATGKGKTTILNAIKDGRISFLEKNGDGYKIDPAELHRVYPAVNPPQNKPAVTHVAAMGGTLAREEAHQQQLRLQEAELKLAAATERLRDKEQLVDSLAKDRDRWQAQCSNLLEDKRRREEQDHDRAATLHAEQESLRQRLEAEELRRKQAESDLFQVRNERPKVGAIRALWRRTW